MKAYKRQKLAVFTFLAGVGMAGSVFAADISSVHVNDIVHKPVITKMQKESSSATSSDKSMTTKKHTRKHIKKGNKKTDTTATSTRIMIDNHKDGEKNDDKGGVPNGDELRKGMTATTTKK